MGGYEGRIGTNVGRSDRTLFNGVQKSENRRKGK
jgi:hypothetical protein